MVRIVIVGHDLPGRSFCDHDGNPYGDVHVGLQVRTEPTGLVRGDADDARWELDVDVLFEDFTQVKFYRLSLRASVELEAGRSFDGFHHVDGWVPQ